MKISRIFRFSACLFLLGAAETALYAEKNFMDAPWHDQPAPAPGRELLNNSVLPWNFNFRPYSKSSAANLWTDPSYQRDVFAGKATAGGRPTAFAVICGKDGFTMYVLSGEPEILQSMKNGKDLPSSRLECYFSPRDAENNAIEHYYQFLIDQKLDTIRDFPWLAEDRNFSPMNGRFKPQTAILPNAYLTRLHIPWRFLWNRLPFLTQNNRIWRFGIMRWAPGGGQTWGGVVHELGRMGYVRWPEFTPERRTAIMKTILTGAWLEYHDALPAYNPDLLAPPPDPYLKDLKPEIRSFNHYPEYRDFAEQVLKPMIGERAGLGAVIAEFEQLPIEEQEAFYRKNATRLINFSYDVQEAFGAWMKQKLIAGDSAK